MLTVSQVNISMGSTNITLWLLRKMLPFLVIGAIVGASIGFLKSGHPDGLRILEIVGSVVFGLMFLLYSWWAVRRSDPGYIWSVPERLGVMASAAAAGILSVRFALPMLPGTIWVYLVASFVLAFIIRPILENYGWKKYHNGQDDMSGWDKPRR